MKLPYRKNAYIPKEKLTEYVLSEAHTVGRLKAKYFIAAGFDKTTASILKRHLLAIAHSQEVKEVIISLYGKKYVIDGKIRGPSGKVLKVTTIWIIETGQKFPRFVTTYPV